MTLWGAARKEVQVFQPHLTEGGQGGSEWGCGEPDAPSLRGSVGPESHPRHPPRPTSVSPPTRCSCPEVQGGRETLNAGGGQGSQKPRDWAKRGQDARFCLFPFFLLDSPPPPGKCVKVRFPVSCGEELPVLWQGGGAPG